MEEHESEQTVGSREDVPDVVLLKFPRTTSMSRETVGFENADPMESRRRKRGLGDETGETSFSVGRVAPRLRRRRKRFMVLWWDGSGQLRRAEQVQFEQNCGTGHNHNDQPVFSSHK